MPDDGASDAVVDTAQAAKQMSKMGAAKGGRARASVLTSEERSNIARKAVQARWAKSKPSEPTKDDGAKDVVDAIRSPEDPYSMFRGTLTIGDVECECHVLSDNRRVLTQGEMVRVLTNGTDSSNINRYLSRNPLYDPQMLDGRTVRFRVPGNPTVATGYEATLLVEICDLYLDARAQKLLKPSQHRLAKSAEVVIRASAKVGIIALVDEATGYQVVREKQALQLKLQAFIAEELQEWARMFPDDFWYELARLEGIRYSPRNRPLRWGKYVMAFVYDAVDGDVGNKLREINPNPHHRKNHHQWLRDHGREKVNNQIQQVIAVMKLCDDMADFKHKFARVFQKTPLQLQFSDIMEWPTSK